MTRHKRLLIAVAIATVVFISSPSIPSQSALFNPALTTIVLVSHTQCEAGVMDQLCSSVMSFLNGEAAKADADAKACRTNCRWKKRKDELLEGAQKKAKESCSKGEAPDINTINKGLDGNAKARLKNLYDSNSRMFDGKAKLADANFAPASSKDAALTGKGGKVTDLKSAEPAKPKLNAPSVFSIAGTKQAGGVSGVAQSQTAPSPASASQAATGNKSALATLPENTAGASAVLAADSAQNIGTTANSADSACTPLRIICADKTNLMITQNMAIAAAEMGLTGAKTAYNTIKNKCDNLINPAPAETQACKDSLNKAESDVKKGEQTLECLKSQKEGIIGKCGGTCPKICACTIEECKDNNSGINSEACLVACKAKKVCISQMTQCPTSWDRTLWNPIDKAIDWAWSKRRDKSYGQKPCSSRFAGFCGEFKCNLFVADAFELGGNVNFAHRKTKWIFPTDLPVSANTLANPNEVLDHYPVIPGGKEALRMGDIVAFPGERNGHTTLYLGKNPQGEDEFIYAHRNEVIITTFLYLMQSPLKKPFVIRRYTP